MSNQRFLLLDGLRGVAAMMVLLYHVFCDAKSFFVWPTPVNEFLHGFLAVDFFFILSGFVMGSAYDAKQLTGSMTKRELLRRRFVRLHPMVAMGVLIGVVCFALQGMTKWDGSPVAGTSLLVAAVLGLLMLPSPRSIEVRGNSETFPLNGPQWSLFFEYVGSLLYGVLLYRLPTKWLRVWVACAVMLLAGFALLTEDGGLAYGWSSEPMNFYGGALRMLYAYPMGLLMARMFRERRPRPLHAPMFALCSTALVVLLSMPSLVYKDAETIYQLACVVSFFPTIIWYAARGVLNGGSKKVASLLGRLSYPLYAVHFPLVYLFISYIGKDKHAYEAYSQPWGAVVVTIVASLLLAALCLFFYDEPLRKRLNKYNS